MVAYSFKSQFVSAIGLGAKRQTVRALRTGRSRHARPGETMQLYYGLRTKHCKKLADVVCRNVNEISVKVSKRHPALIEWIEIAGVRLTDMDVEAFALADGFYPGPQTSRYWMGHFWLKAHGEGRFDGLVLYWTDAE